MIAADISSSGSKLYLNSDRNYGMWKDGEYYDTVINGQGDEVQGKDMGFRSYDAYGNNVSGESEGNPYSYRGYYEDSETGLYYLNARYYDPESGQFLQEDEAQDGINWYAYCAGNPVKYTDPTGYCYGYPDVYETYGPHTDNSSYVRYDENGKPYLDPNYTYKTVGLHACLATTKFCVKEEEHRWYSEGWWEEDSAWLNIDQLYDFHYSIDYELRNSDERVNIVIDIIETGIGFIPSKSFQVASGIFQVVKLGWSLTIPSMDKELGAISQMTEKLYKKYYRLDKNQLKFKVTLQFSIYVNRVKIEAYRNKTYYALWHNQEYVERKGYVLERTSIYDFRWNGIYEKLLGVLKKYGSISHKKRDNDKWKPLS